MDIYFVMDIKNGRAVAGKAGRRDEYVEVEKVSCAVNTSDPLKILEILKPKNVYVADLDRIESRGDNSDIVSGISNMPVKLIADQGYRTLDEVKNLPFTPVIGTETFNLMGLENGNYIVSIDIKSGLLDRSGKFRNVREVLEYLNSFRLSGVLVLPIHSVGTMKFDFSVVEDALRISDHDVLTGGGFSSYEDLEIARDMGISGVLIATAIHRGMIDVEVLRVGKL
ncbi:HisA/HisF family protein [Geoglobus acetivorans]|uniref:HisA/HisF family protein n=1 Tax=Geoglobus acetivorans TaxID=565033 RepID=A0ABZ3H357_GEOAI|nr:HisA/HisF family protein [Geoglobus acetivorans]